MSEIIVDYTRIRNKVNEVNNIINTLYGYRCEVEEATNTLNNAWTGSASVEMKKKMVYLLNVIDEDLYKYSKLRDGLKETADRWERIEINLNKATGKES